jgi:hypothetical protein
MKKRERAAGRDNVFIANEETFLRVRVRVKRQKWIPDIFSGDSGRGHESRFVCKREPDAGLVPSLPLHVFGVYIGQVVSVGRKNIGAARFVACEVEIRGKRQCEASARYRSHG